MLSSGFFVTFVLGIFSLTIKNALSESLYNSEDPLLELDSSNFSGAVLNNNKAWIVEFYNNWCGHCVRYAPTWKAFARDVQRWHPVLGVAVVNCVESQNIKLCREYGVENFPTIKLFWHHANVTDEGKFFEGKREVPDVENTTIHFFESHWSEGVPQEWPDLEPLKILDFKEIKKYRSDLHSIESILLFVEHSDSIIGRKVILDLSAQRNILVRRVLSSNIELLNNLKTKFSNHTLPIIIKCYESGNDVQYLSFVTKNETLIRNKIYRNLVGKFRTKDQDEPIDETTTIKDTAMNGVYMGDIENAVFYSLNNEVGVTKNIQHEKFAALKSYLTILKKYFPGSQPVMNYLSRLYSWLSYKKKAVLGEDFVEKMKKLQSEQEHLSNLQDYGGCRGSSPKYRGYPCSLWTLFHVLTVQADRSKKIEDAREVLDAIKDYIKHFFTCEDCRQNFFKMDATMEKSLNSTSEVVLWLWEAHNKVNQRLAGDQTEDPAHPKVQFPSKDLCLKCQLTKHGNRIHWNKYEVYRFLHRFYGKENIHPTSSDALSDHGNAASVNTFSSIPSIESSGFRWFTNTDISLCISLYFVSGVLLLVIFIFFQRKRRRKMQFVRYMKLSP